MIKYLIINVGNVNKTFYFFLSKLFTKIKNIFCSYPSNLWIKSCIQNYVFEKNIKQSFLKNKLNQNGKFFKIIAYFQNMNNLEQKQIDFDLNCRRTKKQHFPNLQLRNHFSTILLFRKFTNLIQNIHIFRQNWYLPGI